MTKKVLLSVLTLGILISLAGYGTKNAFADNETRDTVISRIAEKFNLKEEDVEAVFEAVRDERQAEMLKEREESLNQAVSDGVLTQSQKDALLNKMKENQETREKNRYEMQQWFSDQGIDETKLHQYLGPKGGRGGKGMGMGFGPEM